MPNSPNLGERVRSQAVAPTNGSQPSIYDLVQRQRDQVALALPNGMDADRFTRLVITQVKQTPRLAECTGNSLLASLMLAAQLGLEPGPLGHCYLVPRRIKGVMEVQFQLGYRGIIDLARRSGTITSIVAREVCENDEFTFSLEETPPFHHTWDPRQDRGKAYCFYGYAVFKDGGHHFAIMNMEEILRHAKRSETWGKDWSPWKTDFDAMARKTLIRSMAAYLPLSAEVARGIATDETVRTRIEANIADTYVAPDYIDARSQPEVAAAPERDEDLEQFLEAATRVLDALPEDARAAALDSVEAEYGPLGAIPIDNRHDAYAALEAWETPAAAKADTAPIEANATPAAEDPPQAPAPDPDAPLPPKARAPHIKDLNAAAKAAGLEDAQVHTVCRHVSQGTKQLPSDLTTITDFARAIGVIGEIGEGKWVFILGDDGRDVLRLAPHMQGGGE